MSERRVWWHWQNLSRADGPDGNRRWPVEGRAWLYVFAWAFRVEWNLWRRACRLGLDLGDEDGILLGVAVPPVSLWFGVSPPWNSRLRRSLPDRERQFHAYLYEWALWLKFGGDDDWRSKDPWWKRGVAIHFDDIVLGRTRHSKTERRPSERVVIRMDGYEYHGTATFERATWKRPRWFATVRDSVWISMDQGHGLPHSGKGENSWDCGDDALYGWGVEGDDVQAAINDGIARVMKYRKRYGNPSRYAPEVPA